MTLGQTELTLSLRVSRAQADAAQESIRAHVERVLAASHPRTAFELEPAPEELDDAGYNPATPALVRVVWTDGPAPVAVEEVLTERASLNPAQLIPGLTLPSIPLTRVVRTISPEALLTLALEARARSAELSERLDQIIERSHLEPRTPLVVVGNQIMAAVSRYHASAQNPGLDLAALPDQIWAAREYVSCESLDPNLRSRARLALDLAGTDSVLDALLLLALEPNPVVAALAESRA